MSLIQINELSFRHDGSLSNLFDSLTLSLDSRWRLGLVGRNGRGKTTFLRLLLGELPYQGSIHTGGLPLDYFPFPVATPEDSARSLMQTLCPDSLDWEIERELSLLELSEAILPKAFCTLSKGEQTKLLLAALFLREGHFLLIDEPTNHLDAQGRALLGRYLSRKSGFILVSHDRSFLDLCIDHVLAINKSGLRLQRGNVSSWLANKASEDKFELAQNAQLQKDISRLNAAAKRNADWSDRVEQTKYGSKNSGLRPDRGYLGHKSAKLMQRAKQVEQRSETALAEKTSLLKDIEHTEPLKLCTLPYHSKLLLELREVSIRYGEKTVCGPLSLRLEQGERLALSGKNGSGKSSLLKLICGESLDHSGTVQVGSGLRISYVPQDASFLSGSLRDYAAVEGIDETRLKTILRKLDFSRDQFTLDMSTFSSGQKKKVLLAKSLCEEAHLLLWDEPLNFIDLHSRVQIEALLLQFRPSMLFIEHDRSFCEAIASTQINI